MAEIAPTPTPTAVSASRSVAEREIIFLVRVRLLFVLMYMFVCYLFLGLNMIRTLAYSHAEYEVYITAMNSRVLYIEVSFLSFCLCLLICLL